MWLMRRRGTISIRPQGAPKARAGKLIRVRLKGKAILEIPSHALDRMKQRGISVDEVIRAIRKPSRSGLPTEPPRRRVRKHRSPSEAIDVVYELDADRIIVVTAFPVPVSKNRK
jgi:hypothetical protein